MYLQEPLEELQIEPGPEGEEKQRNLRRQLSLREQLPSLAAFLGGGRRGGLFRPCRLQAGNRPGIERNFFKLNNAIKVYTPKTYSKKQLMKKLQPHPLYGHNQDKEAPFIKDFKVLAKGTQQAKEMR